MNVNPQIKIKKVPHVSGMINICLTIYIFLKSSTIAVVLRKFLHSE